MTSSDDLLPTGFTAYAEPSGFLDRVGPLLQKPTDAGFIFAVRVTEHHCNRRGMAHGGLVVTLADVALGKTGAWRSQPRMSLLTASLSIDFYGAAHLGDWLEAKTEVMRVGRQVAFGNCYLRVGDRLVARASGVFSVRAKKADGSCQ